MGNSAPLARARSPSLSRRYAARSGPASSMICSSASTHSAVSCGSRSTTLSFSFWCMDIFIIRALSPDADARLHPSTMWSGSSKNKLTCQGGDLSYNSNISGGNFMVECPVCDGKIDGDEEDVDEGDTISCDECGAALKAIGTDPLELESAEEAEEEEEDEEGFVEEEEEEADEDWK